MNYGNQNKVLDDWKQLGINAPTVSIENLNPRDATKNRILITLPVAWSLEKTQKDINHLLGAVAARTLFNFISCTEGTELEKKGKLKPHIAWHKKDIYRVAGTDFIMSKCGSDRPAFTIRHDCVDEPIELLHLYPAQGLKRQHILQQSCLAVVRNWHLALILCETIAFFLDDRTLIVSAWSPEIETSWWQDAARYKLKQRKNSPTQHVVDVETAGRTFAAEHFIDLPMNLINMLPRKCRAQ